MLYSVDHAVGVARDLSDRLTMRLENQTGATQLNTVRQTQDEWGYPVIVVSHNGSEIEGAPVVWIRLTNLFEQSGSPETSPAGAPIDIFGNATLPFTPTVAQIATELVGVAGTAPIPSTQDYSTCLFEISRTGTVVAQFGQPNGTAVTEASITSANQIQVLKDIDWGFKGNT
jgi:hypothetical protein